MAEAKVAPGGLLLVTGASGYIAGFLVYKLLKEGYRVRGTVRSVAKAEELPHFKDFKANFGDRFELVEADLLSDANWDVAVRDCVGVFHTASPFPAEKPENDDVLIKPAVEGTVRVLKACAATNGMVKRVVLTSSIVSISGGYDDKNRTFTPADWTKLDKTDAYGKSKTLAERAAWDFIAAQPANERMELVTVNPGYVQGPLMSNKDATSYALLSRILKKMDPGSVKIYFSIVDVRDVAIAHWKAMTTPEAAGKRMICVAGSICHKDIAVLMKKEFGDKGYAISTLELPSCVVHVIGLCDKTVRAIVPSLGKIHQFDVSDTEKVLNMKFRPIDDSLVTMAYSMIDIGAVPNKLPQSDRDKSKDRIQHSLDF